MPFEQLAEAFQNHIAAEPCWNIPTVIRMSIITRFNELHQIQLSDTDKIAALYTTFQQALDHQPTSELETRQLLALQQFIHQHPWFDDSTKKAILHDLSTLETDNTIPA